LHQDCMAKASNFEAETVSRGEELKALAEAKKAITEMSMGAADQTYSFLQAGAIASISSRVDLANFEAVRFVRDLAKKQHSPELAQLASRMATAMRLNSGGQAPFDKVKGLITDMLAKLEKEAQEEADLNAWCNKEKGETNAKKDDTSATVEKVSTKLDTARASSKQLKQEVAQLQKELADLASAQSTMDELRAEEKALFEKNFPELEMGLKGVKLALKILNDYYSKSGGHGKSDGAGGGIIGMLEVIESDFSKNLAEVQATEEAAQSTYDRETKENEVEKTVKQQDVKYKTSEYTSLDKSVSELSSDKEGAQAELDAINEYLVSLNKKCTFKVETYAERAARREAEVNGLKSALEILNNEVAFMQTGSRLRGVRRH